MPQTEKNLYQEAIFQVRCKAHKSYPFGVRLPISLEYKDFTRFYYLRLKLEPVRFLPDLLSIIKQHQMLFFLRNTLPDRTICVSRK